MIISSFNNKGPQFDLVSASEAIRTSSSRDKIGTVFSRTWDHIVDWFCNTNRDEAKKCLFDLLQPTTTDLEKIEIFKRLETLAGDGCKRHFSHTERDGKESYAISLENGEKCFFLSRNVFTFNEKTLLEDLNSYHPNKKNPGVQLFKDIHRGTYQIADQVIQGATQEAKLAQFHEKIAELGRTPAQRAVLVELCNQSIFASVQNASREANERPIASPGLIEARVEFDINSAEDGRFKVTARSIQDIATSINEDALSDNIDALALNEALSKSIDMNIEVTIDLDGMITLDHVHIKINDDEYKNNNDASTGIDE